MNQYAALIQGAMDSETDILFALMKDREERTIHGYPFCTGTWENIPIVISKTCVGPVNAAVATSLALETFSPAWVLNQGTAGAHHIGLQRGDIVLGKKILHTDGYRTEQKGRDQGYSPKQRRLMAQEIPGPKGITETTALESDARLLEMAADVPYEGGRIFQGVIGTGSGWNQEIDYIQEIQNTFRTDCEEMESFAVAQVCRSYGVPFLAIRIISNNEITGQPFSELMAEKLQNFSLSVVKHVETHPL